MDKYPIEKLLGNEFRDALTDDTGESSHKNEIEAEKESFKEICFINKGNNEMIDKTKTGYIYYKNVLEQIIVNLSNFYNLEDKQFLKT